MDQHLEATQVSCYHCDYSSEKPSLRLSAVMPTITSQTPYEITSTILHRIPLFTARAMNTSVVTGAGVFQHNQATAKKREINSTLEHINRSPITLCIHLLLTMSELLVYKIFMSYYDYICAKILDRLMHPDPVTLRQIV